MIKNRYLLLALLLFVSIAANAETVIRVIHTNDTHARIVPGESKAHGNDVSGAVRRAGLIKRLHNSWPQALILDAGDMFQGTPFFNFFKGEACYRIAAAAGYEATTLGNHELDLSLENLLEKLQISGVRLLCCNVFYRNTGRLVFEPYRIFKRHGRKIAVIGSIGDDAWVDVDVKTKAPLMAKPQTEMVRHYAQRLRPYVDLILVLSHAGYEVDTAMAAAVSEIDVIIGGHTHNELFSPVLVQNTSLGYDNGLNGTIVAQAGEHGIFVGTLQVTLADSGKIATFSGELLKINADTEIEPVPEVERLVKEYHGQLEAKMAKVAGHSQLALEYPKPLKKTHLLPMGTFAANAMKEAGQADICLVNSGGIRAGISAGDITYGDVFEALPYDNTVVTFSMQGQQVKQMLDYICSGAPELDGFQYAGLSGELDFVEARSKNIEINGEKLDLQKVYRVSTSSFIANGNLGGAKIFARVEGVEDSGIFMREAAISYLEKYKELPDFSLNPLKLKNKN